MKSQIGFFAGENRLEKLSELGDQLEKLNRVIKWEIFRGVLEKAIESQKDKRKSTAGRKPFDAIMMFKVLILARINNLSDDRCEFQINDRMTFQRFLGITLGDTVPDSKTIWLFRETLTNSGVIDELFNKFEKLLEDENLIKHEGTLVDASFIDCPRQHYKKGEYEKVKSGETPEDWNEHKTRRKDTDARYTKKGNIVEFGYKNHVAVDEKSKLIKKWECTPANVHDSQVYRFLITKKDKVVRADSAYINQELDVPVKQYICRRAYRNKPLTEVQKKINKIISRVRVRIEHVFGYIENSMGGSTFRGVGQRRANFNTGLTNLVYNLCRYETLQRICA